MFILFCDFDIRMRIELIVFEVISILGVCFKQMYKCTSMH